MMAVVIDRSKLTTLIVDPEFRSAKQIETAMREAGYPASAIIRAADLHGAVDVLRENRISLCLTSADLGDSYTACDMIDRTLKMPRPLPVIVFSDTDDLEFDAECEKRGAAHFLIKREMTASALDRVIRYTVAHYRREADQAFAANHDKLTGLLRQVAFNERITQALHRSDRSENPVCIARVDLQKFESINASHGHDIGDAVLKAVAHRLVSKIRKTDIAARFGSDEFAILLENFGAEENALSVIQKLALGLKAPILIEGQTFTVPVAVGVSFYPAHGVEADSLLHRADVALQSARDAASASQKSEIVAAA